MYDLHSFSLVFRPGTTPDNRRSQKDQRSYTLKAIDWKQETYVFRKTCLLNAKIVNVQEQRTVRSAGSIPGITPSASKSKLVFRIHTNSPFLTLYADPALTRYNVQDDDKPLAHALKFGNKGLLSVPAQDRGPIPAPTKSLPELLYDSKLCAMMRPMAHKEIKHIHMSTVRGALSSAAE